MGLPWKSRFLGAVFVRKTLLTVIPRARIRLDRRRRPQWASLEARHHLGNFRLNGIALRQRLAVSQEHNRRIGRRARLTDCGVLTPRLLTLEQASTYLGLTKDALKAKVHLGRVPTVEIDKKLRFDMHDLNRTNRGQQEDRVVTRKRGIKGRIDLPAEWLVVLQL
jgi:hypothetical protein